MITENSGSGRSLTYHSFPMEPMTNIKFNYIGLIDNVQDSIDNSVSFVHSLIVITEDGTGCNQDIEMFCFDCLGKRKAWKCQKN